MAFLETSLQVILLFHLLRLVKTPIRCLLHIRIGGSVHYKHVMSTVSPFLPEVMDQKVALLLHGLWRL